MLSTHILEEWRHATGWCAGRQRLTLNIDRKHWVGMTHPSDNAGTLISANTCDSESTWLEQVHPFSDVQWLKKGVDLTQSFLSVLIAPNSGILGVMIFVRATRGHGGRQRVNSDHSYTDTEWLKTHRNTLYILIYIACIFTREHLHGECHRYVNYSVYRCKKFFHKDTARFYIPASMV